MAPHQPSAFDPPAGAAGRTASVLAAALARAGDAVAACQVVADHLAATFEVMPSVYLERGGVLRCQAQRGLWQVLDGMPPDAGITGRTYSTGRRHALHHGDAGAWYLEAIPGIDDEVCEPVRVGDQVVGALNVESFGRIGPATRAALAEAADLLGRRLAEVGRAADESATQRLARHATALAEVMGTEELVRKICGAARCVSGLSSALVVLVDESGEPEMRVSEGPLAAAFARLSAADIARLGALVEQVTSCYSAGDGSGAIVTAAESLRRAGVSAVVVLPVAGRGRRRGVIVVADTAAVELRTDDVEPLEVLSAGAALALETADLVAQLEEQASSDPLTGLGNHSAFHSGLEAAVAAATPASPSAVLMVDVDDFKSVNDTAGHLVGDQVLRSLATALDSELRRGDRCFRVGGDEFAALVADADPASLAGIGRRLVRAARPVLGPYGAGLSIGAAVIDGSERAEIVLEAADRHLYDAKAGGGGHLRLAAG